MRETVDRMWAQIREYLAKMPRKNRVQMAILAIIVVTLAIIVVSLVTRTNWVLLPGTGDSTSTSHVYSALNEMGVPNRVEGNSIYVPEDRLGDAQMRLREQGLLGTTDFDRGTYLPDASGFGVSSDHAKQLYDAQRGADIRTQIMLSPRIHNALVLITSGETSPFRIQTNARRAQATVVLTLSGGGMLSQAEAQTIGEIVRTGVPGIAYEDISISDSELNFYRVGDPSQDLDMEIGQRAALQNRLTGELQMQVEQLLAPIFGITNVKVQPNVKLNFDRIVTEEVEFAPPIAGEMDGIIRSSEEIYENTRRWADAEGIPGTDSNALGTVEYPYGTLDDLDEYRRAVISRNYEINETRRVIEHERGSIESLSLAVLINSEVEGVDQDYSAEVTDLVAKAIGVAPVNVSVQQIPFTYVDTTLQDMMEAMEAQDAAARSQRLIDQILMYAVILLLGIMLILFVRTILKAFKPPPAPEPILVAEGPGGVDLIVDDEGIEEREYVDVDLQSKSAGLEQIERFIDKDSASVAQLLRNWLSDD